MRTYYSLLRTTDEVQIQTLVETHQAMDSLLHVRAREDVPDVSALVYCSLRLPRCIRGVRLVVMGQSERVFAHRGYPDVERWRTVLAPGRRRRMFYDGDETLAIYVASISDVDDLIPMLTAFQIEWDKIHLRLRTSAVMIELNDCATQGRTFSEDLAAPLCEALGISRDDLERLKGVWLEDFPALLMDMGQHHKRFAVRLLAGSLIDYRKATQQWWGNIAANVPFDLGERPVHFISSNTHSVVNMLSGFALRREEELERFVRSCDDADLRAELVHIRERQVRSSRENFLYYALKKYVRTERGQSVAEEKKSEETECGILHIDSTLVFDVTAQVVELRALNPDWLDPRLRIPGLARLTDSDAVIINIDYPLGAAAYHILSQVAASVESVRGVYILGKAATLNGRVGDVMIPSVIHDQHSSNTYLVNNRFTAGHIRPDLIYGMVLDNQKSISVYGTFLQNRPFMDVFYEEGFTDIEMEAGPYLSAVYETLRPRRYPQREIVNLYPIPFDIGIIHYASDTPFTKGRNLGSQYLSYYGMDPTYAGTVTILRHILKLETTRKIAQEPS